MIIVTAHSMYPRENFQRLRWVDGILRAKEIYQNWVGYVSKSKPKSSGTDIVHRGLGHG